LWLSGTFGAQAAEPGPGFRRVPATISPNGAYVLAWGWREGETLAKIKEWPKDENERPESDKERRKSAEDAFDEKKLENYLVDAVRGRVVAIVPGLDYFDGRRHADLSVVWSADSREAVAICEVRYGCTVAWMRPATRTCLDITGPVKTAARSLLTKEKRLSAYTFAFFDQAVLTGGEFAVEGWARIPKGEADSPDFSSRLCFRVKGDGTKARCVLLSKRTIPDSELRPSSAAELNEVYLQLRATLGRKERAALDKEQRAWLKEHGEASKLDDNVNAPRISYLRARMGGVGEGERMKDEG